MKNVWRRIATYYVAGETAEAAVEVTQALTAEGRLCTLACLDAEGSETREQAEAITEHYLTLLGRIRQEVHTEADVSVTPSAIGLGLGHDGAKLALDNAATICQAARDAQATVTFGMESYSTVEATLSLVRELRADFPDAGVTVQANLARTEADCRDLAHAGSRVRLCKGAYRAPVAAAQPIGAARSRAAKVDEAYVRCLKTLLSGAGYPMVATHDPRLIEIAGALATRYGREQGTYEYQLQYGVRPDEQQRLAELGERVRVLVPYGSQWYPYLRQRLRERPANLAFLIRSLITGGSAA